MLNVRWDCSSPDRWLRLAAGRLAGPFLLSRQQCDTLHGVSEHKPRESLLLRRSSAPGSVDDLEDKHNPSPKAYAKLKVVRGVCCSVAAMIFRAVANSS